MLKKIVFATALLAPTLTWADPLSDGRDAIELHLIKADRWNAVVCDMQKIGKNDLVFCHPVLDASFGGLYAVTIDGGQPVVHPINGKAKQYMPDSHIEAVNGQPIAVRPWGGDPLPIPDILSAF